MYAFILNMWIVRRITEQDIARYVTKGRITQIEADMILLTPQLPLGTV